MLWITVPVARLGASMQSARGVAENTYISLVDAWACDINGRHESWRAEQAGRLRKDAVREGVARWQRGARTRGRSVEM
jgi:hypothetical protein